MALRRRNVQVDYVVLADAVATESGKHYIHGGGWDTIFAGSFPATHPVLAVAVRLRVPWGATNEPHEITLDLLDSDGNSVLPTVPPGGKMTVGRPPQLPPGSDQAVPLAFNLASVTFQHPGAFEIVVRIDGLDAYRSPFRVLALQ